MGVAPVDDCRQIHELPRERGLADGFETLSDVELVAVLLGTGERGRKVTQVAFDLLEYTGGLGGLAELGVHSITGERGVGIAKAARIGAALELGRRVLTESASTARLTIGSSAEVAAWARPRLLGLDHEQVWVLSLDGRNGLRAGRRVAEGGLHGCSLEPRDVLRVVLRTAASAFVLVHNHPSGDPSPSEEDIDLTTQIAECGRAVGTPLVDHVIVAGAAYSSLFDLGVIRVI